MPLQNASQSVEHALSKTSVLFITHPPFLQMGAAAPDSYLD